MINLEDIVLHTCCAPCSVKCIDELQKEGVNPLIYWYNPNIHPYMEYKSRKNTLIDYTKVKNLKLVLNDEYGLRSFINGIYPDFSNRCEHCYKVRLNETAKYAHDNGYKAFSTTLLISPYQKHELIKKVAEKAAKDYGIEFLYRDFRPYFREDQKIARELGLYMQKYCGCVFSEEERYLQKQK